jgi:hypothetical protein
VTHFKFVTPEIEIASPFGGIVYITAQDVIDPVAVDVTLRNVARHPLYALGDRDSWEDTKDCPAPWAEIETHMVIFTVPTRYFQDLDNFEIVIGQIDRLIVSDLRFLSDMAVAPYRVVFDVDIAQREPEEGPIYVQVGCGSVLFTSMDPSSDLFTLLNLIGRRSLPNPGLPNHVRDGLAILAAISAIREKWPEHRLLTRLETKLTPMAHALNGINTNHPGAIPEALRVMRERTFGESSSTYWRMFLAALTDRTGMDYTNELNRVQRDSEHGQYSVSYGGCATASKQLSPFRISYHAIEESSVKR